MDEWILFIGFILTGIALPFTVLWTTIKSKGVSLLTKVLVTLPMLAIGYISMVIITGIGQDYYAPLVIPLYIAMVIGIFALTRWRMRAATNKALQKASNGTQSPNSE